MEVLAPLIPYLLIGIALNYVLNLRGMKHFRQAMDQSGVTLQDEIAQSLARMGEEEPTTGSMTREVFEATLGLRAVASAGVFMVLLLLFPYPILSDAMPFSGVFAIEEYVLFSVILGYYLYWVHTYRVEVQGHTLTYRNILMKPRRLDLRDLYDVEDDHAYNLRLYFYDQPRAEIFKTLKGGAKLRRKLVRWLEINGRL